jgi:hypothetical protein
MLLVVPKLARVPLQAQPGFMHQRRGLEGLPGTLARKLPGSQAAQVLINQRQQLLSLLPAQWLRRFTRGIRMSALRVRWRLLRWVLVAGFLRLDGRNSRAKQWLLTQTHSVMHDGILALNLGK